MLVAYEERRLNMETVTMVEVEAKPRHAGRVEAERLADRPRERVGTGHETRH